MPARTGMSSRIVSLLNDGFTGTSSQIAKELRVKRSKVQGNMTRLERTGRISRVQNTHPLVYKSGMKEIPPAKKTRIKNTSMEYKVFTEQGITSIEFYQPVQIITLEDGLTIRQY